MNLRVSNSSAHDSEGCSSEIVMMRRLREKDFITKTESVSRKRKGRREYLNASQTRHLMKQLHAFFEAMVEVPRMRIGKRQTIETLISEEALLLAKFLRNERKEWNPRLSPV